MDAGLVERAYCAAGILLGFCWTVLAMWVMDGAGRQRPVEGGLFANGGGATEPPDGPTGKR